jgi:hypothetical protein
MWKEAVLAYTDISLEELRKLMKNHLEHSLLVPRSELRAPRI